MIRKFEKLIFPFTGLRQMLNYDVVQIINCNVFGGWQFRYNYNCLLLSQIKKHSHKMFMMACGEDHYVFSKRDSLRYNPFDEAIMQGETIGATYTDRRYVENNIRVAELVDGIIPGMYEYAEAYREHENCLATIPFPINIDQIQSTPQRFENNRLKIFHGILREGFKGTRFIKEAMLRLKENYPNDVDILIDGRMPLKKYLKVLEETNVIVDQALSYSYGMNAIYSMAMGKVVLSGNEPECQQEFGRKDIPIINILPSADDIYAKLEKLVLNKDEVIDIGNRSREFIEDFHDYRKVAQRFVDTWSNIEVKS
jgi:glycosyltransferase involved in cell wall biosynthesis